MTFKGGGVFLSQWTDGVGSDNGELKTEFSLLGEVECGKKSSVHFEKMCFRSVVLQGN